MARSQEKSRRSASGSRLTTARSKRKFELARRPAMTRIADVIKRKVLRIKGGNSKQFLLTTKYVNVAQKGGKVQKTTISTVLENQANANLVRRNILTKGAIVETPLGKVRITSRPGQEGGINGVLLS